MCKDDNKSFDEFSFTENNTTENEINKLELMNSPNPNENLLDLLTNKNSYLNTVINKHNEKNEQKSIEKMYEEFVDKNEEFEVLSSNLINDEGKSNIYFTKIGKKHSRESTDKNSSHNFIEKNKEKTIDKKIFEISKPIYRLDYYKKKFIENFLDFLLNLGKKLLSECNFEDVIKLKLHKPSYKLYAGNPKEKDNREFLKKQVKIVLVDYDKNNKKENRRQKDNEKLINFIYKNMNFPSTVEEIALDDFFNMTIEEGIKKYYESEFFIKFKKDRTIQYYDGMFFYEKNRNFSLLKNYGFIKLVNLPFYSNNPK